MTNAATGAQRLFGHVMFWTILTGIFAWLPLVRIAARPEGYTWGILGVSGRGTQGPFWIFILLTAYVLTMLFSAFRGPRAVFYPMLVIWHVAVTAVVIASVTIGGTEAVWQGQGLGVAVPMWILSVPFVLFTVLAIVWVVFDRRAGGAPSGARWVRANTVRLVGSIVVLGLALLLFRAGTNYNWVTASAIVATVLHWILLVESLAPQPAQRG
jgi:hypothetical protein